MWNRWLTFRSHNKVKSNVDSVLTIFKWTEINRFLIRQVYLSVSVHVFKVKMLFSCKSSLTSWEKHWPRSKGVWNNLSKGWLHCFKFSCRDFLQVIPGHNGTRYQKIIRIDPLITFTTQASNHKFKKQCRFQVTAYWEISSRKDSSLCNRMSI